MSCSVIVQTNITNANLLGKACDRMRKAGLVVEGPHHSANHHRQNSSERGAYLVKLPGWYGEIAFYCDRAGTSYHDSDYTGPRDKLDRLVQEYSAAVCEDEVAQIGGMIGDSRVDSATGLLRIELEIPEGVVIG